MPDVMPYHAAHLLRTAHQWPHAQVLQGCHCLMQYCCIQHLSKRRDFTLPLVALEMSLLLKVYSAARPVPSLGCSLYMSAEISSWTVWELLSTNV